MGLKKGEDIPIVTIKGKQFYKKVYRGKPKTVSTAKGYDTAWSIIDAWMNALDVQALAKPSLSVTEQYEIAIRDMEYLRQWHVRHEEYEQEREITTRIDELRGDLHYAKVTGLPIKLSKSKPEISFSLGNLGDLLGVEIDKGKTPEYHPGCLNYVRLQPSELSLALPRIAEMQRLEKPEELSVKDHIKEFITLKYNQAIRSNKQVKLSRGSNYKTYLAHFSSICGQMPVKNINEEIIAKFADYLTQKIASNELSPDYCKTLQSSTYDFIKHLWRKRALHELPRNLGAREFGIGSPDTKNICFSDEEIKRIINFNWKGKREEVLLYTLLGLNCAMTIKDCSDLLQSEVDWINGTIKRVRSKISGKSNGNDKELKSVQYPLWPKTFELLKKFRQSKGERVFLTSRGTPLKDERFENGVYRKTDSFHRRFSKVLKKLGISGNPKMLRKCGPNKAMEHPQYKFYFDYYLNHSPKGIGMKNYVGYNQEEFNKMVNWVGEQWGLVKKTEQ